MKISVIITAGGAGKRLPGKVKKQFLEINGKPILFHTIARFSKNAIIDQIIVSLPESDFKKNSQDIRTLFSTDKLKCVIGGKERQDSVYNALKKCSNDCDIVFIHDGVRPLFSDRVISESLNLISKGVGTIPASRVKLTLKECVDGTVVRTVSRDNLYNVHTPQGFMYKDILELHTKANKENIKYTDDAALYEVAGYKIKIVNEDDLNIKITTVEDLELATYYLEKYSGVNR